MQWIKDLWQDGQWYEHVYMVSVVVMSVSLLAYLSILAPYTTISNQVEREYRKLSAGQFFLSFRKAKQQQLYNEAELNVSIRNKNFIYYRLGSLFSASAAISFGVGFWFFVGSLFYERVNLDTNEESPTNSVITTEDDSYSDDSYEDYDDNTHHVDPHWVDGYERSDGTEVDGYWRGGEDGYERSDPDGDISNNLDSSESYSDDSGSYDSIGEAVIDSIFGE